MTIATALQNVFPSSRASEVEYRIQTLAGSPNRYVEDLDGLHVPAFFATDVGAKPGQVDRFERLLNQHGATLIR